MSSAVETRFRIPQPATSARAVKVIPLDPASDRLVAKLAKAPWKGVTFFRASRIQTLIDELSDADLVVMVTAAGADAQAAALIGKACSDSRIHTATFVMRPASATDEALSETLAQVRPWSLMVVVASDESYVEDILRSFR